MVKMRSCIVVSMVLFALLFSGLVCSPASSAPGSAPTPYHQGKNITLVVGSSAGGTVDGMARLVAKHWPNHIPGKPTMIVENRTGGGQLIAARYVYDSKPDGLTLLHSVATLSLQQLLGKEKHVDFRRYDYLGCPAGLADMMVIRSALPHRTIQDLLNAPRPVRFGGIGSGTLGDELVKLSIELAGLKLRLVSGYSGFADVYLAVQQGELDAATCDVAGVKTVAILKKMYDEGFIRPIVLCGGAEVPEKYKAIVKDLPYVGNHMKPAEKQVYEAYTSTMKGFRPFAATPGTPPALLTILRDSLWETMKDPAFVADADKGGWDLTPMKWDEAARYSTSIFDLPKDQQEKLIKILK